MHEYEDRFRYAACHHGAEWRCVRCEKTRADGAVETLRPGARQRGYRRYCDDCRVVVNREISRRGAAAYRSRPKMGIPDTRPGPAPPDPWGTFGGNRFCEECGDRQDRESGRSSAFCSRECLLAARRRNTRERVRAWRQRRRETREKRQKSP